MNIKKGYLVRKLNRTINSYLRKFGCSVELDTDFSWYRGNRKPNITYSLVVSENLDTHFTNWCKELRPNITAPVFILSLFHEVGHNMTDDDLTNEEEVYSDDVKAEINRKQNLTVDDIYTYFRLPDELQATEWGLDYIETHPHEIRRMIAEIEPIVNKIYAKYSLSD